MPGDGIPSGGDTWGISGSTFLLSYGLIIVVVGVLVPLAQMAMRRGSGDPAALAARIERHPGDVAFLTGGPNGAVLSAIGALRTAGVVRASSLGRVQVVGPVPRGAGRLDHAVHSAAARGMTRGQMARDPRVVAELEASADRLLAGGLVSSPGNRAGQRLLGLAMVAVFGFGVIRLVAGSANNRPVGFLVLLVVPTVFLSIALIAAVPRRTGLGRRVLQQLRGRWAVLRPSAGPAWATYGPAGAALSVALFGTGAIMAMDPNMAIGLHLVNTGGGGWSGNGWSNSSSCSSSSSSSCGGGGSSCGGGGGGGCGG